MGEDKRKNVLLLVADQFRYDCQGFINEVPVLTPNLDRLAEDAFSFENAYTAIPTCCPSRQSFYAGRRCESFHAYWNYNLPMAIGGLPLSAYSFLRDFTAADYQSVHVGVPELSPEYGPEEYGYLRGRNVRQEYELLTNLQVTADRPRTYDGWIEDGELCHTLTGYTASCAMEELERMRQASERPFFLTVCFTSPHPPYNPHRQFYQLYRHAEKWGSFEECFENKPYIQRQQLYNWGYQDRTWADWEPVVRKYYAAVTEVDFHIGRILDWLKQEGLYDDTLIVFTADHGDLCGAHRMFDKHYVLYEDVTHVPLLIKTCGRRYQGRSREYTVHNLDLAPTLMELCGIATSAERLDGYSLVPVLQGGKSKRREAVSTENGAQFGLYIQRCIKTDAWKYIWNPTDVDELYCLREDPYELVNRIGDQSCRTVLRELKSRLLEILIREGDGFCDNGKAMVVKQQLCAENKVGR